MSGFGVRVFEARERADLTQQALAAERGRTQTWLSYIESGQRNPRLDDLAWLCERLGLSFGAPSPLNSAQHDHLKVVRAEITRAMQGRPADLPLVAQFLDELAMTSPRNGAAA